VIRQRRENSTPVAGTAARQASHEGYPSGVHDGRPTAQERDSGGGNWCGSTFQRGHWKPTAVRGLSAVPPKSPRFGEIPLSLVPFFAASQRLRPMCWTGKPAPAGRCQAGWQKSSPRQPVVRSPCQCCQGPFSLSTGVFQPWCASQASRMGRKVGCQTLPRAKPGQRTGGGPNVTIDPRCIAAPARGPSWPPTTTVPARSSKPAASPQSPPTATIPRRMRLPTSRPAEPSIRTVPPSTPWLA
jgi:hypothetical protein